MYSHTHDIPPFLYVVCTNDMCMQMYGTHIVRVAYHKQRKFDVTQAL